MVCGGGDHCMVLETGRPVTLVHLKMCRGDVGPAVAQRLGNMGAPVFTAQRWSQHRSAMLGLLSTESICSSLGVTWRWGHHHDGLGQQHHLPETPQPI